MAELNLLDTFLRMRGKWLAAMKMKCPDEDMTVNRAQDWRPREALTHVGQWDDFVTVLVWSMQKERFWLIFQMVVSRESASVVATVLRQARGLTEPSRLQYPNFFTRGASPRGSEKHWTLRP